MNYNTDRPIENCNQDLLGRATFAKQLGKAIFEYNSNDGLVVGLYGKWGTGKTSVINMALNELSILSLNEENKPIMMRFAPWNYSDKDNLISIFFHRLKNVIDLQDNEELKNKVGKALSDYSGAFDALSLIPVFGSGVAAVIKTIAKAQGESLMQRADLATTRKELEKALLEVNKKIIIVIDDIDRLTNSQIRDIFQLVKQVADFPNVIYILAMEREVVRRALTEVHDIDGNEYLEKIIQIPFELPELRRSKLLDVFFVKLDQIIGELPVNIVLDKQYWGDILRNCIEPYVYTLRDVNRVINTFQFKYGMLYQETSFEDMVGITTIEVLEPELYKWISNNKDAVCGGLLHSLSSSGNRKKDYRKQYSEEFSRIGIDPEKSIKCISTMFPVFAKDVDEHYLGYQNNADTRRKMRAAHEERFELYFMFDLEDIKVPRSVVNACIYDSDPESLRAIIEDINSQGNSIYFLEELRALIGEIPYERLGIFISVLISIHSKLQGTGYKSLFTISAADFADYCIFEMIQRLNTEDERYGIIHIATERVDKNGLAALARIINRVELGYGRLDGATEKKENQLLNLDQLQSLEQLYVTKLQDIIDSESLVDLDGFSYILYLWELLDKEGAQKYINDLFKDEFQILKFICAMAGRWNGTNGSGWSFNSNRYSSYISDEEVYDLIQNYDKKSIDLFSDVEQVKLATFILNYHKDEMDHANEQEAFELVEKWKKE